MAIQELPTRFWKKVQVNPGSCWEWTGCLNSCGYGRTFLGGKHVYAHRLMFEAHNGPLGEGLQALHRCDNPKCVNPDHLFAGTRSDNMRDMVAKGRHAGGPKRRVSLPKEPAPAQERQAAV